MADNGLVKLEQIETIVKAVKRLFQDNNDIQEIIKSGNLSIDVDTRYNLKSIEFEFYDSVQISQHAISITPEHGKPRVIATYSSLVALPKLKKSDLGL